MGRYRIDDADDVDSAAQGIADLCRKQEERIKELEEELKEAEAELEEAQSRIAELEEELRHDRA